MEWLLLGLHKTIDAALPLILRPNVELTPSCTDKIVKTLIGDIVTQDAHAVLLHDVDIHLLVRKQQSHIDLRLIAVRLDSWISILDIVITLDNCRCSDRADGIEI